VIGRGTNHFDKTTISFTLDIDRCGGEKERRMDEGPTADTSLISIPYPVEDHCISGQPVRIQLIISVSSQRYYLRKSGKREGQIV